MILNRLTYFLVCLFVLQSSDTFASDVDTLIDAHVLASGGRETLYGLETITRKGEIEFFNVSGQGPSGIYLYRTDIVYPSKLREELKTRQILVDRGTDGLKYWEWTGSHYSPVLDSAKQTAMAETAERANRNALWLKREIGGLGIAVPPSWATESNCISGTKLTSEIYVCFDKRTNLMSAKGDNGEYRIFTNWQYVGGILIPFILTHYVAGRKVYQIRLKHVEIDQPIEESRFLSP